MIDGEQSQYSYREFAEGDEAALVELLKTTFPSFLKNDFWAWKYKLNPNFDPSLVVVAEKDGEMVGCNHWLMRDLRLSRSLEVRAALAADIMVHPKHRGRGIGKQLLRFLRLSGAFQKKQIILSYMFAPPNLNKRLYAPVAGYEAAPNSTTTYKKFFNCQELKKAVQRVNALIKSKKELQTKLKGLRARILFRLKGFPVFAIYIDSNRVYLEEGEGKNLDMVVEGSLPLSSSLLESNKGIWFFIKAWITGELRIRKGLSKIFKVLKAFEVLRLAFNED